MQLSGMVSLAPSSCNSPPEHPTSRLRVEKTCPNDWPEKCYLDATQVGTESGLTWSGEMSCNRHKDEPVVTKPLSSA